MKRFSAIHLTESDPRSDSRVMKEVQSGLEMFPGEILVVGLENNSRFVQVNQPARVHFFFLSGKRVFFRQDFLNLIKRMVPRFWKSRAKRPLKKRSNILKLVSAFLSLVSSILLPLSLGTSLPAVFKALERSRPSLIHVHSHHMLILGVLLKAVLRCRLIYDAHELESEVNGSDKLRGAIIRRKEKALWRYLDGFITVSSSIEGIYLERNGKVPSAVVLNAPITSEHNQFSKSGDLKEALGIDNDSFLGVYLGYLTSGRGIDLMIDSMRFLPNDFHVVFVGDGPKYEYIESLSLVENRIHLLPPVEHSRVVSFVSAADFGICLIEPVSRSDYYSLPNKLFEYLFAGLPILGSPMPEIENIVSTKAAGQIVRELEPREVAKTALLLREKTLARGVKNLEDYTWTSQSDRMKSLYRTVIEQNPSGRGLYSDSNF